MLAAGHGGQVDNRPRTDGRLLSRPKTRGAAVLRNLTEWQLGLSALCGAPHKVDYVGPHDYEE